jgi:putative two-component system response regulator
MQSRKYNYLVADDDPNIQKIISDILTLHTNTLSVYTAKDGDKAFQTYLNNKIDIIIIDVLMPGISGLELIKKIMEANPEANIIIISASNNINIIREAMRNGAYDYIIKPFSIEDIMFTINRLIERMRLLEEKKSRLDSLEHEKGEVSNRLKSSFTEALSFILETMEANGSNVKFHSNKTALYSANLASAIGLGNGVLENIKKGSILYDIGKIGTPGRILSKPAALHREEFEIVKKHVLLGRRIVEPVFGENDDIINIIYYHHERYDGEGYPDGLKGAEIPLVGRVMALTNAFDAMTAERPYRKQKTREEAIDEIRGNSGTQFDPELVREFLKII